MHVNDDNKNEKKKKKDPSPSLPKKAHSEKQNNIFVTGHMTGSGATICK